MDRGENKKWKIFRGALVFATTLLKDSDRVSEAIKSTSSEFISADIPVRLTELACSPKYDLKEIKLVSKDKKLAPVVYTLRERPHIKWEI